MLHTDLMDAENDVFLEFKSSPFGSHSHGYDAQNSFVLYAYSEPLLIRTGRRDSYGSKHHREWMWETKSVNSILVNGTGQRPRSSDAQGRIVGFHTSKQFDYVAGEASDAYPGTMKRFTRHILFIKPELILIFDQLEAPEPSTFQWCLHSPTEMQIEDQRHITVEDGQAGCHVDFLHPQGLQLSQTDKFDTPPRPRIKLTQWHLQAAITEPATQREFVTLIRPYRKGESVPVEAEIERVSSGYACRIALTQGAAIVLLRTSGDGMLEGHGAATRDDLAAVRLDSHGEPMAIFSAEGKDLEYRGQLYRLEGRE